MEHVPSVRVHPLSVYPPKIVSHLQKCLYVLCQWSSFGVEESLTHETFQEYLKMGMRLADFSF